MKENPFNADIQRVLESSKKHKKHSCFFLKEEIVQILDKIKSEGIDNLSCKEIETLRSNTTPSIQDFVIRNALIIDTAYRKKVFEAAAFEFASHKNCQLI